MHPDLLNGEIYGIYQVNNKRYKFTITRVQSIETMTVRDNNAPAWLPNEYEMEARIRAGGLDVKEIPDNDPEVSEKEWEDMILKGVDDKNA